MEQVLKANSTILEILGKAKTATAEYRLLKYCLPVNVEEGTLLFNLLTRELVLLTPDEYACALELDYLRQHWFVVPEETDEKKLVGLVRWISGNLKKKKDNITSYTILTTTDCNARCFYCYERGRFRTYMSEETAVKTANFIKEHCGGKEVKITWFGGEPTVNSSAINVISEKLRADGVAFSAMMVSNGYLIDDATVARAMSVWNLHDVQITLDGTEDVYNRSKAFVYSEGSAYQVVISNIARLLDAGISVNIRLNVDFYNVDDLMELADELAERFAEKKGLNVYSSLIFDDEKTWNERYTLDEWAQLYDAQRRLDEKLKALGLYTPPSRLRGDLKTTYCMADNDAAVVIVPDGHLGRCRHFSESEFIGHIDSEKWDRAMIASWKERCEEIPACNDCFRYPECMYLKKCKDRIACIEPARESLRRRTEYAMINQYRRWQDEEKAEG